MASSITLDLSTVGDKVAAAIQESMQKMITEKVAAATEDIQKKDDETTIAGLREQILANSALLFPILLKRQHMYGGDGTPCVKDSELSVITLGEGTTISARVLYKISGNKTQYVLLAGPEAPDHSEALWKLLGMSSMLVNKRYTANVFREQSVEGKQVSGGGMYYTTNE